MLRDSIRPVGGWNGENDLSPPSVAGISATAAFHIVEMTSPAWIGGAAISDTLNHLFACFFNGSHAVIYSSDSEMKDNLFEALDTGKIVGWEPVDEKVLLHAYVMGKSLRTLWLAGTHRSVTVKPNSKILSGESLADAIDPFGDSTFIAGAIRSTHAGVSLKRSGVWFGRKKDWDVFSLTARSVLSAVQIAAASPTLDDAIVHVGLALVLKKFIDVGPVSDIEWVSPETINGNRRAQKLTELTETFEISVTPPFLPSEDFYVNVVHRPTGVAAYAKLVPTLTGKKLRFGGAFTTLDTNCQYCVDAIIRNPDFVRVLYNSGHTIAGGNLTLSTIQDRDFDIEFLDFALTIPPLPPLYDVWIEKPPGLPPPLQDMFLASDRSLFKWVFKEGIGQLGMPQPSAGTCWLYCDDRSGEVADFIHFSAPVGTINPKITLIHVKGAHSKSANRNISTSAYEVVTAQAMKNLRRMNWSELHSAIEDTVSTHGSTRVWDAPWIVGLVSAPGAPAAMLAALKKVGATCDYEVIVVQPHVMEAKYLPGGRRATGAGAAQLRNLLFTAKAASNVAMAQFRVISAKF